MKQGGSHYWNKLHVIGEIDLTFMQFAVIEKELVLAEKEIVSREYILSFLNNLEKYNVLRNRVRKYLGEY